MKLAARVRKRRKHPNGLAWARLRRAPVRPLKFGRFLRTDSRVPFLICSLFDVGILTTAAGSARLYAVCGYLGEVTLQKAARKHADVANALAEGESGRGGRRVDRPA